MKGLYTRLIFACLRILFALLKFTFKKFNKNQKFKFNQIINDNLNILNSYVKNSDLLITSDLKNMPKKCFPLFNFIYNPDFENFYKRFTISHQGFINLILFDVFIKELNIKYNESIENDSFFKKLVIENLVEMSEIGDKYIIILNVLTELEKNQNSLQFSNNEGNCIIF